MELNITNPFNVARIVIREVNEWMKKTKQLTFSPETDEEVKLGVYILDLIKECSTSNTTVETEYTLEETEDSFYYPELVDDKTSPLPEVSEGSQELFSQPSSQSSASSTSQYELTPPPKRVKVEDKVPFEEKKRIVDYAFGTKSGEMRQLSSIQTQFRGKGLSKSTLYHWKNQVEDGLTGDREEERRLIREKTLAEFQTARASSIAVHDIHLRRWALETASELGAKGFKASDTWLYSFKQDHKLKSLKVTHFTSKSRLKDEEEIAKKARAFVERVVDIAPNYDPDFVFNADQSGFNKEMISNRTIQVSGTKKVQALVQSTNATTHSYTILPLISMAGKLKSPMLVVLSEPNGRVSDSVWSSMIKPGNLHIAMTPSGKMGKKDLETFVTKVLEPNLSSKNLLLFDSWSAFKDKAFVRSFLPNDKDLDIEIIPEGATGAVQPLDVFGFRQWKALVKHFSDYVRIKRVDFTGPRESLQTRENILKLQSIIHNQLSSPRFQNMWKYSWYKAGYVSEHPGHFDNPVDFCFKIGVDNCADCNTVCMVRCSWCKKYLCFSCFFSPTTQYGYHMCSTYIQ